MVRVNREEILDIPGLPDEIASRAYRDLARIHRVLGDTASVIRAIRRDPLPVRRVMDIGCGMGHVLHHVQRKLQVEVTGVDVQPRPTTVPMVQADAIRDTLPPADVAFSMYLAHHLSEREIGEMIRNVGRSCRRFILLDLVRHPLPLALFRAFVAPFVCSVVVRDGTTSLRRAYTPPELRRITHGALAGSPATFRHTVTVPYTRQIVDITY
jgi:2-polyprenyl-3-methyl-5-hydroxy-6-metoxy-1,4-benzoquinol methylase